jgi:hypothetical protein
MFACLKLDEAGKGAFPEHAIATAPFGYFVQDMQQACYQGWHLGWSLGLGVVCTLMFCVGLPASLLWYLRRNRQRLNDPAFQAHFGFLYADYRPDRCCWEVLVAARTVVLVCIAVFASVLGAYYAAVMFVVVFHISLVLQLSGRPFAFAQPHRIQLAALGCLDLTACITLTFFTVNGGKTSAALSTYKEVAGAVTLAIHAAFISWCVWVMCSGLRCQRGCAGCAQHCMKALRQSLRDCATKICSGCLRARSRRCPACVKAPQGVKGKQSSPLADPELATG